MDNFLDLAGPRFGQRWQEASRDYARRRGRVWSGTRQGEEGLKLVGAPSKRPQAPYDQSFALRRRKIGSAAARRFTGSENPTRVKLRWDEEFLYVGAELTSRTASLPGTQPTVGMEENPWNMGLFRESRGKAGVGFVVSRRLESECAFCLKGWNNLQNGLMDRAPIQKGMEFIPSVSFHQGMCQPCDRKARQRTKSSASCRDVTFAVAGLDIIWRYYVVGGVRFKMIQANFLIRSKSS